MFISSYKAANRYRISHPITHPYYNTISKFTLGDGSRLTLPMENDKFTKTLHNFEKFPTIKNSKNFDKVFASLQNSVDELRPLQISTRSKKENQKSQRGTSKFNISRQ